MLLSQFHFPLSVLLSGTVSSLSDLFSKSKKISIDILFKYIIKSLFFQLTTKNKWKHTKSPAQACRAFSPKSLSLCYHSAGNRIRLYCNFCTVILYTNICRNFFPCGIEYHKNNLLLLLKRHHFQFICISADANPY